jgi:hypothetical protein
MMYSFRRVRRCCSKARIAVLRHGTPPFSLEAGLHAIGPHPFTNIRQQRRIDACCDRKHRAGHVGRADACHVKRAFRHRKPHRTAHANTYYGFEEECLPIPPSLPWDHATDYPFWHDFFFYNPDVRKFVVRTLTGNTPLPSKSSTQRTPRMAGVFGWLLSGECGAPTPTSHTGYTKRGVLARRIPGYPEHSFARPRTIVSRYSAIRRASIRPVF